MGFGYRRRRTLSADEIAANAAARAERERHAMTCQICGRKILANTGSIAHHGYERPYDGWQTSSCFGAKHLPFENDSTVLAQYITILENEQQRLTQLAKDVSNEITPVVFSYEERQTGYEKKMVMVTVTSATFGEVSEQHKRIFVRRGYLSFSNVLAARIHEIEYQIRLLTADLVALRIRLKEWKLTHRFNNGFWVKE